MPADCQAAKSKNLSVLLVYGAGVTDPLVTRFAPSPSGRLHLGHAYAALFAHRVATETGGRFLLRIEDIDSFRRRDAFETAIEDDLRWLGLDWDGPVLRQSERDEAYGAALDHLRGPGDCCTRAFAPGPKSGPRLPPAPMPIAGP